MLVSAKLRKRFVAIIIDLAVFSGYLGVLALLSVTGLQGWIEEMFPNLFRNPLAFDLLAFITAVLPLFTYFSLMEQSPGRGTLGKRIMKIRVETTLGNRLSFARSLIRSTIKFLPWQLAHTAVFQLLLGPESLFPVFMALSILAQLLVVGNILSLLLGKERRAVHDLISGTRVVAD